ncbi:hypothetical protein CVT26_004706 [Gymnopilus dilepis]|uniref:C-CAP/cofactor C-like domain-containing protein n=1 Tax=Gymnopilus dilepis TaxID=231916 RepID=A0A409XZ64_9AGAR|nr:hypothetical protein CVT26_004706 [Gymnopilus dilepis]
MADSSTWSFSQNFSTRFQEMRSELESQIAAARTVQSPSADAIQTLSLLLAKATKALADATGSLPTYDQKQYEGQLKSFEKAIESLRTSSSAKPKFAFKRKPQTPAPGTSASSSSPALVKDPSPPPHSSTSTPISSNVTLSSHRHKNLTRADLQGHPLQTDLSLSDLDNCVVNLLPSKESSDRGELTISALHARNLTNCVIILPIIQGSALLHDLTRCIIVLGCHQFRMHSSERIDVLLYISSNPIIEDCRNIRFTKYPNSFLRAPAGDFKGQLPLTVQDFSHIRPTPSPNFSIMNDADATVVEQQLIILQDDPSPLSKLSEILPQ